MPVKLSEEDQETIATLKKEVERAWSMVEASHEKEVKAKATMSTLKTEIRNLGKLVEQGASLAEKQESQVNTLTEQRDELQSHRDLLQGQVDDLSKDAKSWRIWVSELLMVGGKIESESWI